MKIHLLILTFLFNCTIAWAQFTLLKDANPGTGDNNGLYLQKVKANTWVMSWNGGPTLGQELWRTDGTTGGTSLIKDLYPGAGWGTGYSSNPYGTVMNNQFYFVGSEQGTTYGLYKTDATAAGTTLLAPILTYAMTNIDGTLYFAGNTPAYGNELYKTDGTTAGTVLIKDIRPATASSMSGGSHAPFFVKANGYIFFRANDGTHGAELWRTDGTADGTQMVKDIFPGSGDGLSSFYDNAISPEYMVEFKGNLYFVAQQQSGKDQLWRTDGTEAGTYQVTDINEFNFTHFRSGLAVMGDNIYFIYGTTGGNAKLYKCDGTAAGVKEVSSQTFATTSEYIAKGYNLFYFSVFFTNTGFELWRSDGTEAGTFMIKDLNPGPPPYDGQSIINYANCFVNWDNIYFTGNDGSSGLEMFTSDGSAGNMPLLFDAEPGIAGSSPVVYNNVGGKLSARFNTTTYGSENWISNDRFLILDLLSFTASRVDSTVNIQWTTRNEDNTLTYEIERSSDSINFSKIGTLQAQGAVAVEAKYLFPDPNLPVGKHFYRLRIINTGNNIKYSHIIAVEIPRVIVPVPPTPPVTPPATPVDPSLPQDYFKLFPNPSKGMVTVKMGRSTSLNAIVQITDAMGRIVKQQTITYTGSPQSIAFDLSALASDVYTLGIMKDGVKERAIVFVIAR